MGQPTVKNPKGREPLILKESQKEVDPLFLRKKGKNGNFGWKEQKECDKISCRRITYEELKHSSVASSTTTSSDSTSVEELPIRN